MSIKYTDDQLEFVINIFKTYVRKKIIIDIHSIIVEHIKDDTGLYIYSVYEFNSINSFRAMLELEELENLISILYTYRFVDPSHTLFYVDSNDDWRSARCLDDIDNNIFSYKQLAKDFIEHIDLIEQHIQDDFLFEQVRNELTKN